MVLNSAGCVITFGLEVHLSLVASSTSTYFGHIVVDFFGIANFLDRFGVTGINFSNKVVVGTSGVGLICVLCTSQVGIPNVKIAVWDTLDSVALGIAWLAVCQSVGFAVMTGALVCLTHCHWLYRRPRLNKHHQSLKVGGHL